MKTDIDFKKITDTFEKIIKQQNEFFLTELDKRFSELAELKQWQKDLKNSVYFPKAFPLKSS